MRLYIITLIAILAVGSFVILLGFLTNQEYVEISEITNQFEKLEIYKNELDKINQLNLQMLQDLETQLKISDDIHLEQINDEINVIKQVINENKEELEQIIKKISQIEPESWFNTNLQKFNLVVIKIQYIFGLRLKHFLDCKIISNYLILRSCREMRLKFQKNYENSC